MDKQVWQVVGQKGVQVLGLDLWNGSQTQLATFKSITGVTFPLLLKAGEKVNFGVGSAGSVDALMVVDRKGIIQRISNSSESALGTTVELIDRLLNTRIPAIHIPATGLNFGTGLLVGEASTLTVRVENTGSGNLSISEIRSDLSGITVSPSTLLIGPGGNRELQVTLTPGSGGPLSGQLYLTSNDPDRTVLTLPISGTATVVFADPRVDFTGDGQINLADFIAFARAYNSSNPTYDLDENGTVGFGDFVLFARSFGRPLP
ncbi:MAG: choice-of-anchor D domain-containing protein [bacterium]|nr:choice-of-anchor D domain-containing protein [bacterium]